MQAKQVMLVWSAAVLVLVAIQGLALAQKESPESVGCFRTATSGSGATFMRICVSNHGNLTQFESPQGFQHINSEGYVVCSGSPFLAHGYDAGGIESGFEASTNSGWTFTRTTTDGIFRLKQVFTHDKTEKDVTITMTLTNLSNAPVQDVYLTRYFDGDVDNSCCEDIYSRTLHSVDGRDEFGHGLMLTALTFGLVNIGPGDVGIETFGEWSRETCLPPTGHGGPTAPGDYVGRITYTLGTINAGASKTVKFLYRRF